MIRAFAGTRIACEWLEPRMVCRLKQIGERITERNAA